MVVSSDVYADDDFAIQMLVAGMVGHEENVEAVDAPATNSQNSNGAFLQSPVLSLGSLGYAVNDYQQGAIEKVSTELNKVHLTPSTGEQQQATQIQDKENLYPLNPTQRKGSRDVFVVLESNTNSGSGLTPPKKKFREAEAVSADNDILARHIKVSKFKSFRPRPGMSSSIVGSSSSFTRPKPPPPITSENGSQTGNYSFHHVPLATPWTLPIPWGVIPSGKTISTQTAPNDTVELHDQDFQIFVDNNHNDSFASINEFEGLDTLEEPDHSGVHIVKETRFFRNIETNTMHVPWRRVTRRVPQFKEWMKASKTWSKSKESLSFGTQTEEHITIL